MKNAKLKQQSMKTVFNLRMQCQGLIINLERKGGLKNSSPFLIVGSLIMIPANNWYHITKAFVIYTEVIGAFTKL